jgi:uncharacterized pyridoxal phosphate-containing UPF0001 family protein
MKSQINAIGNTVRQTRCFSKGSYKIAIEEGANIIRIGTKLFGERS